jgi:putative DNA primase/helicase
MMVGPAFAPVSPGARPIDVRRQQPPAQLGVDLDVANAFLAELGGDTAFTFQTFADAPRRTGGADLARILHGSLEQCAATLQRLNGSGAGIFVTVNKTDLEGRRDENIQAVRALFLDLDGSPLGPVLAASEEIEPHLIIESSPGRWHCYWRVSDCQLGQFKSLQKALATRFGGDAAVNDLPRVMRLPGFVHQKGEPFRTRIHRVGSGGDYRVAQLVAALDLELDPAERRVGGAAAGPVQADDWYGRLVDGSDLHDSALHIVGRMVAKGFDDQAIRAWFEGLRPRISEMRGAERAEQLLGKELDRMLAGARSKGYAQPAQTIQLVDEATGEPTLVDLTVDGVAMAFARAYRGKILFDHVRGAWLRWDGTRWCKEETQLVFDWVRRFCRKVNTRAAPRWAKAAAFSAVERIAQSDRTFARTSADFDQDLWLLATPEGTVDLKTGRLRVADPDDMITRRTAVAPAPPSTLAPRWQAFLEQATRGDADLIRFLRQLAGYSLVGVTTEQCLVFVYGPGGNGKGVFVNTLLRVTGDYGQTADMAMFTASRHDRHPTDLAALKGARLVVASETEQDRVWAEARIKQLTGGDRIRARFMHCDEFEFEPQFQLVIVGNHKPRARVVDDAMRRRLAIVNFLHRPPVKNPNLEAELREEWPAILRWMIDGCLDWQRHGLVRPASVEAATAEYFAEQDLMQAWLDEKCDIKASFEQSATPLFRSWSEFAKAAGEEPGSQSAFGADLTRRGFLAKKGAGGVRLRQGLRLRPAEAIPDPRTPGDWT